MLKRKIIVRCDEISAITRVVRVFIKNKIDKLIMAKIKIVQKIPNAINRVKVR